MFADGDVRVPRSGEESGCRSPVEGSIPCRCKICKCKLLDQKLSCTDLIFTARHLVLKKVMRWTAMASKFESENTQTIKHYLSKSYEI